MGIKLVALDLDDTLLGSDLKISEKNKETIKLLKADGVNITLATGRMFPLALEFAQELDIDIPLITYQGAMVKESKSNKVLYLRTVPVKSALQVINRVKHRGVHYQVYLRDKLYMEKLTPEGDRYCKQLKVEPVIETELPAVLTEAPIKILIINDNRELLVSLEKDLQTEFGNQLYITRSKPNYLEVMNKEATKLKALEGLAETMGITRQEVMAIGDSYTDLDIIRWAGIGVAMANSIDDVVKRAADYITVNSNDADGVAEALERFVLKKPE